jgi:hypothetical protein
MKRLKFLFLVVFAALVLAGVETTALGQTANDKLASVTGGASVHWDVSAANSGLTLIVSAPDGRTFRKDYKGGSSAEFALVDKQGERLPDGVYTYELRLNPLATDALKSRAKDDASEEERTGRKRATVSAPSLSGSFAIVNGSAIVEGAQEGGRSRATTQPRPAAITSGNTVTRLRNHRAFLNALPDQVIPDDLIVQGSACVGLDCVNNESFSFDTIRLKENNTRISFNDTSTSAGFPTNDWTIRANSSASGGASFLAFVDRGASENGDEVGTIVFEVDAGAPANSLKVSSAGKVGIRTATPTLDLHISSSDTPAHRLEQTSAGGFTAQTWDIGANEANFFVRDVTGGSRLPFRIRPGAPTSSIDISASGNVGVGTASPNQFGVGTVVHVNTSASDPNGSSVIHFTNSTTGTAAANGFVVGRFSFAGLNNPIIWNYENTPMAFATNNTERLRIDASGNVGIATTAPTDTLSVNGTASKPGGGSWAVFSDERLKTIKGNFNSGLKAVMQLQPIRYQYKPKNIFGLKPETENIGFGAQALQKVIPEAVTRNSNGYLMVNNDPILWTMLNAIKEQQKEIAALKGEVRKLRAASQRRRK